MEGALPTALAPCTLETLGEWDFAGRLGTAMTAHPKMDPETGEMLFFGYAPFPPYLTYHVADRTGALVRSEPIDVAWPSMIHDFAVTRDHVVFILCPLVFSFENVKERGGVFSWEPERGTRLGVMPRTGGSADVRWFETDASYVFHPLNAYDDGDRTIVDVARYDRLDFMSPKAAAIRVGGQPGRRMHRWTIDRAGGGVKSTPLDDVSCEFPRADERRLGRRHRYGYAAVETAPGGGIPVWSAIRRYDLDRGTFQTRDSVPAAVQASRSSSADAGQRRGRRLGAGPRLRRRAGCERLPRPRCERHRGRAGRDREAAASGSVRLHGNWVPA
jgi:carotenoid cleavage dioxygenase